MPPSAAIYFIPRPKKGLTTLSFSSHRPASALHEVLGTKSIDFILFFLSPSSHWHRNVSYKCLYKPHLLPSPAESEPRDCGTCSLPWIPWSNLSVTSSIELLSHHPALKIPEENGSFQIDGILMCEEGKKYTIMIHLWIIGKRLAPDVVNEVWSIRKGKLLGHSKWASFLISSNSCLEKAAKEELFLQSTP